ncbi:MAG: VacJ family lipoprotein [Proteobacteria bacterium]|nr:VacJ family lipoprotein [Pseudomonadota bacterium]
MQLVRLAAALMLGLFLAACSTTQESIDQNDPFEKINREVFAFNHGLDNRVALPAATFYRSAAPPAFREHLHYFLTNLHLPVTFANDVLQGNFERGGEAAGRFAVNSTVGFVGVFDVATGWGMPYHQEDFGQTMGWYGVGEGPYLVVPLAGPAVPRDIAGGVVDGYLNPLGYIQWKHKNYYFSWPLRVLALVDSRSLGIDALRDIQRSSIDLYATTRSLYRQSRNAEIHNGQPDVMGLPDF